MRRVGRKPVDGAADTGGARSTAEARPAAGAAGQGERGKHGDEHGAERRREENAAVPVRVQSKLRSTVPARQRRRAQASRRASVSAQRPKGAEARGIAAVIGGRASGRRFERRARSRSDAPKSIVASVLSSTMICTSGIASIGNAAGSIGGRTIDGSANVAGNRARIGTIGERANG